MKKSSACAIAVLAALAGAAGGYFGKDKINEVSKKVATTATEGYAKVKAKVSKKSK